MSEGNSGANVGQPDLSGEPRGVVVTKIITATFRADLGQYNEDGLEGVKKQEEEQDDRNDLTLFIDEADEVNVEVKVEKDGEW